MGGRTSRGVATRPVANVTYLLFTHDSEELLIMFNLYLWIFAEICGLLSLVTTF